MIVAKMGYKELIKDDNTRSGISSLVNSQHPPHPGRPPEG